RQPLPNTRCATVPKPRQARRGSSTERLVTPLSSRDADMLRQPLGRHFFTLAMAAGILTALPVKQASACGGFFCSQSLPVNQAAERIVFAQNQDDTVTAVIQIMYEGPSESFSWL